VNPKETVGQLIYDLGNKQWDIPKLRELLETILPQKATFDNYEVEHDFSDIGRRTMLLNARQIERASGKDRIILLAIEDITQRKRVEEELANAYTGLEDKVRERTKELRDAQDRVVRSEKMAVVGQLASSVAHELRNPLGVMKNAIYYLNMLGLGKDNPDFRENLEIISSEIENSNKVIGDLLEFSRIKKPDLKREEINGIIKETLARVKVTAGIKIVAELGENLPPIQIDARQMQQVFYNLAFNAIQAMEKGGTLTISSYVAHDGTIAVAFKDTGCGISQEHLKKIFDPLFSTKAKGTGLGLSVVRMLTEGHEGKVEAESEAGKGSAFTVKLPIITR
jgi:signal transduction histidine kinase